VLERVALIEAELARLTARTEELENRVAGLAADLGGRLSALEVRLADLAGAAPAGRPAGVAADPPDPSAPAPALAGPAAPAAPAPAGPLLAASEQADFDVARAAYDRGELAEAAGLLAAFAETYPAGPLTQEALVLRGEALAGLGELREAARAFLAAFTGAPDGPAADRALLRLGESLAALGQRDEACVMLGEVGARFPASPWAAPAAAARQALACP